MVNLRKSSIILGRIAFFALGFINPAFAVLNVSISDRDGLPIIKNDGASVFQSGYGFWGKDWSWANHKTKFKVIGPGQYSSSALNKKLKFRLNTQIDTSKSQLSWTFDLNAQSSMQDVIGGGIIFKLNKHMLEADGSKPVLLPDNSGWKWKGIEVQFKPALAFVGFERGKAAEIRAYFYKDKITAGEQKYVMTLSLPKDAKIMPARSERFSTLDHQSWPKITPEWQDFPIDLSFLNAPEKPAGKHGFISAVGEQLVFEDGTVARFWGTNMTANSLFKTSKDNIQVQAKRLSKMGFNLVRIHHHDSPWVNPNIFGDRSTSSTQRLSQFSLDNLDWWIKSLKDEGIYVWLDLHVQRNLKRADEIDNFEDIFNAQKKNKRKRKKLNSKRQTQDQVSLKGFNYVNQSIQGLMKAFNRSFISHVNSYTKLAYKDEPAIVALLITNENDLTQHFGNKLLPNKGAPIHSENYMALAEEFALENNLNSQQVWKSWVPGASKIYLNDLEQRFNSEMIADLKEQGVKVPIVTTSTWGRNPLSSLPALTVGDIIDVHAYGKALELEKSPLKSANMTNWMAAGQVSNKPMSVTEWNVSPFPAPDRHANPLFVASKADHQGWDAMMHYAYAQGPLNSAGKPSNWQAYNDPSLLTTLPAAALLYRQGHVKEATSVFYLAPGEALFNEIISPETSVAIRTASEKGKLVIAMPETDALPWLQPSSLKEKGTILEDYKTSVIDEKSKFVRSDTGELYRNWAKGIYTIDTAKSQAAMGWLGGEEIKLSDVVITIKTANATVAIQSLDGEAIRSSNKILISIGVNSIPEKQAKRQRNVSISVQPIEGELSVKAKPGMKLSLVTDKGKRNLPVKFENSTYVIDFKALSMAQWLVLEK